MKKRFFDVAEQMSFFSDNEKHKIGAVIVYKKYILGLGYNKNKTSPKANHPYKHLHAEESALINAAINHDNVIGSTLYLYRKNKKGELSNARPCPYCMKAVKDAGIKRICYTIDGVFFEEYL